MNPKYNLHIPKILRDNIIDFALYSGMHYFEINNDPRAAAKQGARRFCKIDDLFNDTSQMILGFREIAYEHLGTTTYYNEPMFGSFIGVNQEGGSVHEHQDDRDQNGNWHLRYNFMIQKPNIGGNPIINGKEYWIDEGEAWINYASEWKHGSTPVAGNRERIVLSLGACVPEHIVKNTISSKIGWEH